MGVHGRIADIQPFAELAQGPSTIVYKAYQRPPGRPVLLKVLRPSVSHDEELARRFEAEARLVAQIQHSNVVAIYAHGRENGQVFLAAEFVEGVDGRDLLARGPLPPELATFIVLEAARGLQAAHARGILHRDLKPSNILVSYEGQVKLTDFGMASFVDDGARPEVRGTPGYLAPELVRGEPPTKASDVFSLGATFYEALAGRPAFTGTGTGDLLDAVLHHDPLPYLERFTDLPADLHRICARFLAKDPDQRYPDTDDLLTDLEAFVTAHGAAAGQAALAAYLEDPSAYRATRQVRGAPGPQEASRSTGQRNDQQEAPNPPVQRRRPRWALGLAVVLLLLAGAGGGLLFGDETPAPRPASLSEEPAQHLPEADTSRPVGAGAETNSPSVGVEQELEQAERVVLPSQEPPDPVQPVPEDTTSLETPAPPTPEAVEEPVAAMGTLHLAVAPWADVYVEDNLIGRTPLRPLSLAAGTHRITLKHPQFPEDFRAEVEIFPNEEDTLNVTLWGFVGRLWITVSPWAEVRIDGVLRDTIPPQKHPLVVAPGEHTLVLRHPDLGAWETTFVIAPGETQERRFNLHRLLGR